MGRDAMRDLYPDELSSTESTLDGVPFVLTRALLEMEMHWVGIEGYNRTVPGGTLDWL